MSWTRWQLVVVALSWSSAASAQPTSADTAPPSAEFLYFLSDWAGDEIVIDPNYESRLAEVDGRADDTATAGQTKSPQGTRR